MCCSSQANDAGLIDRLARAEAVAASLSQELQKVQEREIREREAAKEVLEVRRPLRSTKNRTISAGTCREQSDVLPHGAASIAHVNRMSRGMMEYCTRSVRVAVNEQFICVFCRLPRYHHLLTTHAIIGEVDSKPHDGQAG